MRALFANSVRQSEAPKALASPIVACLEETLPPYPIFSIIRKNVFFQIIKVFRHGRWKSGKSLFRIITNIRYGSRVSLRQAVRELAHHHGIFTLSHTACNRHYRAAWTSKPLLWSGKINYLFVAEGYNIFAPSRLPPPPPPPIKKALGSAIAQIASCMKLERHQYQGKRQILYRYPLVKLAKLYPLTDCGTSKYTVA